MNAKNLLGMRFGRLRVVSEAPRQNKRPKERWWHCVCDCGNEIDTYTSMLTKKIDQAVDACRQRTD